MKDRLCSTRTRPAEVAGAAVGVEQQAELGRQQRHRHRVDGEVAAVQVLPDRGVLDRRAARPDTRSALCGRWPRRRAGRRPAPPRCGTSGGRACGRPKPHGSALGEGDAVALHRQVDVEAGLVQQQVADGAADQVERRATSAAASPPPATAAPGRPGRAAAGRGRRAPRPAPPVRLAQRPQQVAAGDDAEHLVDAGAVRGPPAGHRHPARAAQQRPLHLGQRRVRGARPPPRRSSPRAPARGRARGRWRGPDPRARPRPPCGRRTRAARPTVRRRRHSASALVDGVVAHPRTRAATTSCRPPAEPPAIPSASAASSRAREPRPATRVATSAEAA